MTQMNVMSASALTMEELENVNGGRPHVRISGPRRNSFKRFMDVVDIVKNLVNTSGNN